MAWVTCWRCTEGGDKRRGGCPVVRMARASVEPERPWAAGDDQAVTQETAEAVPQKGKGAHDDGDEGG